MKNKKNLLCILLAIVMVVSAFVTFSATESHFTDVPADYWAHDSVERAYSTGIVKGTSETAFTPEGTVTNAQYIVMLARGFYTQKLEDYTLAMTASDVKWWEPAAEVVYGKSAIDGTTALDKGHEGGLWNEEVLSQPINRYDMAQMMYNIMVNNDKVSVTEAEKTATHAKMSDWANIPAGYQDAVATCYALSLLSGTSNGTFNGAANMTRAQAATVICRMMDAMDGAPSTPSETEKPVTPPAETEEPADQAGTGSGSRNSDGTTSAAGVNGIHDRIKKDSNVVVAGVTFKGYPTTGKSSDTPNKNGYYTAANVDLGNATLSYDLLDMVNEARAEEGLSALEWVPYDEAEEYTLMRANELTQKFSHGRPNGVTGISGSVIASGQTTSREVFQDWMESQGHKDTLIDHTSVDKAAPIQYMCAAKAGDCWIITVWDEYAIALAPQTAPTNYD